MKQRIITAVIGLLVFIPILIIGGWPFYIISYALATVGLYELIRMFSKDHIMIRFIITIPFLWYLLFPGDLPFFSAYEVVIIYMILLFTGMVITKNKFTFDDVSRLVVSLLFISTAFHFLIILREAGLAYLLFVLFLIWTTDSGAYFTGRFFGKRKLWPAISPNKTIGGAVGGFLLALVVGICFQLIYPLAFSFGYVVLFAGIISIVGQLGDLVASAMKRHYAIKDYGKIFPGHGGVLDRLDSVLFVALILFCLQFV